MAGPIAVFGYNRRWEPAGSRPRDVCHPRMLSLDLSWVASITSTTRAWRETGRYACLPGNAGHDIRLSTIRPPSFAGQIPPRFGLKMAPPAPLTKIHWSHSRLKQSSFGIITANNRMIRLCYPVQSPNSLPNDHHATLACGFRCHQVATETSSTRFLTELGGRRQGP